MMLSLICLVTVVTCVLGGSVCPSRKEIYPCTCANVPLRKNHVYTIVTCNRLGDSDTLNALFPALRALDIDQFYLYDSFWDAHQLGAAGEAQKVLPSEWITLLKIREIEIVDTTLASCFACQLRLECRNSETTKFKVTNSSSSEKICTLCDAGRGNKFSWTACMSKLKEFHFNHGRLTSLSMDFFPIAMKNMVTLNLAYNQISRVEPNALQNLEGLVTIDLSHNAIEFFDYIFGVRMVHLKSLDVSFNAIKTFGDDLFPGFPELKVFNAESNAITALKEGDWRNIPKSLRNINLNNNPFLCDCTMRWINRTFHVSVNLQGTCSSPDEYLDSPLRRTSRSMIERCDTAGKMGARKPVVKRKSRRPVGSY